MNLHSMNEGSFIFFGGHAKRCAIKDPGKSNRSNDKYHQILNAAIKVFAEQGYHKATISQVALAWMLTDPVVTSPIIGATSIQQLNENLGALNVKLSEDEMALLNKMTAWKENE